MRKLLMATWLLFVSISLSAQLQRFEFSHGQMGTQFRIVVYAEDSTKVEKGIEGAFAKIDSLNAHLSDYLENSEVSRLSQMADSGQRVAVSEDLWRVLIMAQEVSIQTKGAFDVTIGPLSKLWRSAFLQMQFPDLERIAEARKKVNYRWVQFFPKTRQIRLRKKGMRLDLGGIGKGYALDEAMAILHQHGLTSVLLDGGGDLLLGDPPPGQTGWEIQYGNSGKKVFLSNQAVATSGDTYRYLEWEGKRYSHIIDPRTGLGIADVQPVTVRCSNAALADAYASALSVLGLDIQKIIRRLPDDIIIEY